MNKGEFIVAESVFAGLYLRGLGGRLGLREPGLARRRWPKVEAVLRGAGQGEIGGIGSISQLLRRYGLWDEAAVLDEPGRLDAALSAVLDGRVLTVFSALYPGRWRFALGAGAPPVLWRLGYGGEVVGEAVGVVGVRDGSSAVLSRAYLMGAALAGLGRVVCSGGAWGVDRAAVCGALSLGSSLSDGGASGRLRAVEVLPFGMDRAVSGILGRGGGCLGDEGAWSAASERMAAEGRLVLSLNAPEAGFTSGQAMERNALIYAYGMAAVVVAAHFKRGGTWAGATDALRRRLTAVLVGMDGGEASLALTRLGGMGLRFYGELEEQREVLSAALAALPVGTRGEPTLFGSAEVRERREGFGIEAGGLDLGGCEQDAFQLALGM